MGFPRLKVLILACGSLAILALPGIGTSSARASIQYSGLTQQQMTSYCNNVMHGWLTIVSPANAYSWKCVVNQQYQGIDTRAACRYANPNIPNVYERLDLYGFNNVYDGYRTGWQCYLLQTLNSDGTPWFGGLDLNSYCRNQLQQDGARLYSPYYADDWYCYKGTQRYPYGPIKMGEACTWQYRNLTSPIDRTGYYYNPYSIVCSN
jgi:hypothetical protein